MKLEKAYSLSTGLVALSGLAALLITREAPDWLIVPATALVLAGTVSQRLRPVLPRWLSTALLIAAVGLFVLDFLYIGGSLIVAGADFLVILLLLKHFSPLDDADRLQLFVISFFLLLASTGLSTEIYFVVPFCFFFVSLSWALILKTIKSEAGDAQISPERFGVGGSFFLGTGLLTVLSMAVTVAIFLVIPRVGIGYLSKGVKGVLKVSGFSDTVTLGSMGQVLQDPSAVMRVQAPGMAEKDLYWRGRAFDYYSGESWTDTLGRRGLIPRDAAGVFYVRADVKTFSRTLSANITLEPMDTDTLFAPYPAYEITGSLPGLFMDPSGGIHFPYPPGGRVSYSVRFPARVPAPDELKDQPAASPPGPAKKYLQMPKGSEALIRLAGQVTEGTAGLYDKIQRISEYLGKNCSYTLSPKRDGSYSPMDDFLFHTKEGYCEHFATAMVLMLRATGVHARLVSGFMGGEWNDYGRYYLVRARDAHTWVEAYFPDSGWVRFDPTPSAAARAQTTLAGITDFIDYLKYRWDRYVVFYNLRDQLGAMRSLARAMDRIKNAVPGSFTWGPDGLSAFKGNVPRGKGLLVPAATAALALLLYAAWRLVRLPGRKARGRRSDVTFYEEFLKIIAKKGYVRRPGLTPLEFARDISGRTGQAGTAVEITELYNRVRFGGTPLSRDEKARVAELLIKIKDAVNKEGRV
jgi:transglutaminase-like putative cysteine protease